MNEFSFQLWLEAYGRTWENRDPQAAAKLYADGGTYQLTPFLEPLRGSQAILDYWTEVATTEKDISFGFEILAVTEQFGIARWHVSFFRTPQGLNTKFDGVSLISLNADSKCVSLREWWHKQQ